MSIKNSIREISKNWFNTDYIHNYPRGMSKFMIWKGMVNLIGLEIGTWRGIHSAQLMKRMDIKKLYLVDNYYSLGVDENREDDNDEFDMGAIKSEMKRRMRGFNYELIDESSETAHQHFKDKMFDFIYIDGDHSYKHVSQEIRDFWRTVKEGGVMGGHDFVYTFTRLDRGVVKAVLEFVVKENLKLYVKGKDWWVVKGEFEK